MLSGKRPRPPSADPALSRTSALSAASAVAPSIGPARHAAPAFVLDGDAARLRVFVGGAPTAEVLQQIARRMLTLIQTRVTAAKLDGIAPVCDAGSGAFKRFGYVNFILPVPSKDADAASTAVSSAWSSLSVLRGSLLGGAKLRMEGAKPDFMARLQEDWAAQKAAEAAQSAAAAPVPAVAPLTGRVRVRRRAREPCVTVDAEPVRVDPRVAADAEQSLLAAESAPRKVRAQAASSASAVLRRPDRPVSVLMPVAVGAVGEHDHEKSHGRAGKAWDSLAGDNGTLPSKRVLLERPLYGAPPRRHADAHEDSSEGEDEGVREGDNEKYELARTMLHHAKQQQRERSLSSASDGGIADISPAQAPVGSSSLRGGSADQVVTRRQQPGPQQLGRRSNMASKSSESATARASQPAHDERHAKVQAVAPKRAKRTDACPPMLLRPSAEHEAVVDDAALRREKAMHLSVLAKLFGDDGAADHEPRAQASTSDDFDDETGVSEGTRSTAPGNLEEKPRDETLSSAAAPSGAPISAQALAWRQLVYGATAVATSKVQSTVLAPALQELIGDDEMEAEPAAPTGAEPTGGAFMLEPFKGFRAPHRDMSLRLAASFETALIPEATSELSSTSKPQFHFGFELPRVSEVRAPATAPPAAASSSMGGRVAAATPHVDQVVVRTQAPARGVESERSLHGPRQAWSRPPPAPTGAAAAPPVDLFTAAMRFMRDVPRADGESNDTAGFARGRSVGSAGRGQGNARGRGRGASTARWV